MKKFRPYLLVFMFLISFVAVLCKDVFISSSVFALSSSAKAMVVMEASTQTILSEKNKAQKLPIASTTKILTAIVVLEKVKDLDAAIVVPNNAVGVEGSSIYLKNDEEISVRSLLYGLMLSSGNDSAVALALTVAGSIEEFAKLMNIKAQEIGAVNSNFTCPHGLDDKNNYSTAEDLAKIAAYGIMMPSFEEICSTKNYKINATNKYQDRYLYNKNKVLRNVEGGIGVKTGYTKKAGRCLVGAAKRDGMTIVTVVINCAPMFEETYKMLDDAFNQYRFHTFLEAGVLPEEVIVLNGEKTSVKVANNSSFKKLINKGEEVLYRIEYELLDNIEAPVLKTNILGKVKVYKEDELVFEANLTAMEDIAKIVEKSPLEEIIENFNK